MYVSAATGFSIVIVLPVLVIAWFLTASAIATLLTVWVAWVDLYESMKNSKVGVGATTLTTMSLVVWLPIGPALIVKV